MKKCFCIPKPSAETNIYLIHDGSLIFYSRRYRYYIPCKAFWYIEYIEDDYLIVKRKRKKNKVFVNFYDKVIKSVSSN